MKTRVIAAIIAYFFMLIVSSCATMEEAEPFTQEKSNGEVAKPISTKAMIQEDSLQLIMAFQTNKKNMLLHQIKEVDGIIILDIVEEDIRDLNIPDSLYNWALRLVNSANSTMNQ